MINDFQVIAPEKNHTTLNDYEKELIDDISHLPEAINDADSGKGADRNCHVNISL